MVVERLEADKFEDEEAAKQYMCAICQEVHLVNLVSISNCGHIFGADCLAQNPTKKCPTCRTKYKKNKVFPLKFVERQIGCLQIRCNHSEECDWKGMVNDLKNHNCPFELLPCPRTGCFERIQRRNMEAHLADEDQHYRKHTTHNMKRMCEQIKILKRQHVETLQEIHRINRRVKRLRRGKWAIHVKTLTGKTITCDIEPTKSLYDLTLFLQEDERIPLCCIRLIFAGRQLDVLDDGTPIEGITVNGTRLMDDCALHLILRPTNDSCVLANCICTRPDLQRDLSLPASMTS